VDEGRGLLGRGPRPCPPGSTGSPINAQAPGRQAPPQISASSAPSAASPSPVSRSPVPRPVCAPPPAPLWSPRT
jgi:hypothetical protein